jgi:hypothetical protein
MITDVTGGYLCILLYTLRFAVGMVALVTFLLCLQENRRDDTFYVSIIVITVCSLIPSDLLVLPPKEEPRNAGFPVQPRIPTGPYKPAADVLARRERNRKRDAYLKRQEEIREAKANDPAWQEYYRQLAAAQRAAQSRSRSYRSYSSSSGSSSWPTRRDDDDRRQEWTPVMNLSTGQFDMVHRDGYSYSQ